LDLCTYKQVQTFPAWCLIPRPGSFTMNLQLVSDSSCSSLSFRAHRTLSLSLSSHQLMMLSPEWTGQTSFTALRTANEILPSAAGLRENRHLHCCQKKRGENFPLSIDARFSSRHSMKTGWSGKHS